MLVVGLILLQRSGPDLTGLLVVVGKVAVLAANTVVAAGQVPQLLLDWEQSLIVLALDLQSIDADSGTRQNRDPKLQRRTGRKSPWR